MAKRARKRRIWTDDEKRMICRQVSASWRIGEPGGAALRRERQPGVHLATGRALRARRRQSRRSRLLMAEVEPCHVAWLGVTIAVPAGGVGRGGGHDAFAGRVGGHPSGGRDGDRAGMGGHHVCGSRVNYRSRRAVARLMRALAEPRRVIPVPDGSAGLAGGRRDRHAARVRDAGRAGPGDDSQGGPLCRASLRLPRPPGRS